MMAQHLTNAGRASDSKFCITVMAAHQSTLALCHGPRLLEVQFTAVVLGKYQRFCSDIMS